MKLHLAAVVILVFFVPRMGNGFTCVTVEREGRSPETIVHAACYAGKGGELVITLGLHSDFADTEGEVSFSARHIAAVWASANVSSREMAREVFALPTRCHAARKSHPIQRQLGGATSQVFSFVDTTAEATTEVQLTFPSAAPTPALQEAFEWAADPMEE